MLSKPPSHHPLSQVTLVIAIMNPSSTFSSSTPPNNPTNSFLFDMECNLPLDQLPPELFTLVTTNTLQTQAYPLILKYQPCILRHCGDTSIQPIGIHPKYPFVHPFFFPTKHWITFPKETLCFMWYLYHFYSTYWITLFILLLSFPFTHS